MAMECTYCHTPIPVTAASDPCPKCGRLDRNVFSSDSGVGKDDWSKLDVAVQLLARAQPEEVAEALTEIGRELGVSVAFTVGASGFTVTQTNGVSQHYGVTTSEEATARAVDAAAAARVAQRAMEIFGAAPTARQDIKTTLKQVLLAMATTDLILRLANTPDAANAAKISDLLVKAIAVIAGLLDQGDL